MKGRELRGIRKRFGLSQAAFGRLVGVAQNSVARWERDEMRITESAARLVRLLGKYPELASELAEPVRTTKK